MFKKKKYFYLPVHAILTKFLGKKYQRFKAWYFSQNQFSLLFFRVLIVCTLKIGHFSPWHVNFKKCTNTMTSMRILKVFWHMVLEGQKEFKKKHMWQYIFVLNIIMNPQKRTLVDALDMQVYDVEQFFLLSSAGRGHYLSYRGRP